MPITKEQYCNDCKRVEALENKVKTEILEIKKDISEMKAEFKSADEKNENKLDRIFWLIIGLFLSNMVISVLTKVLK